MKPNNQTRTTGRRSIRLKGYDYSQDGMYFITLCVKNRACLFGRIENGKMILNDIGEIAKEYWQKIGEFHNFVKLGSFIIMPNHAHGIIKINNDINMRAKAGTVRVCQWQTSTADTNSAGADAVRARQWRAPTIANSASVRVCQWQTPTKIQLPPKSLPSLINHYKGAVKKWADRNKKGYFFWQRNYYENIIRNDQSLERIEEYIINNPRGWKEDSFFNT